MPAGSHPLLPPGVIVLERGWLSSNNVVLVGDTNVSVVDSGYWTHAQQTVGLVEAAATGRRVDTLVNTHLHSDHCGGNSTIQARFPEVQTRIPPGLAAAVREWDPVALTYEPTGQHCPPFRIDGVLTPGQQVQLGTASWEIHSAPGHDPHSVVLFEPRSRALISADALWQNGFGVVFQELEGERAFDEVASTLDLIEKLAPAVVVPGHGAVFTDVKPALGRARSRLAAYVSQPARHAVHAAKVLLKFKLLELQRVGRTEFGEWAENTRYFQLVRQRWFPEAAAAEWIDGLLEDLVRSGAAARQGETILNA